MAPKRLPIKSQARKLNRKRSTGGGGGGTPGSEPAPPKSKSGKGTEQVHEAFVRAFGIPTNMYRYLARRHRQRPLFLQRSLTYMRERGEAGSGGGGGGGNGGAGVGGGGGEESSPADTAKTPAKRSLEQIVTRLVERANAAQSLVNGIQTPTHFCCDLPYNASLTLHFTGLFDSPKEKEWETVEAELDVLVVHQCFDRRKNCATCITKTLASHRWLPCNPPGGQILDESGPTGAGDDSDFAKDGPRSNVFTILYKELIENTRISRTETSHLILRVRAKERRLYLKVYDSPPHSSKRSKRSDRYEVRYRACLPLLRSRGHLELLDGEYEARLEVDQSDADATPDQAAQGCLDGPSAPEMEWFQRRQAEWLSLEVPQTAPEMVEFESWPGVRFSATWQGSRQPCQRGSTGEVKEEEEDDKEEASSRVEEPMEEDEEKEEKEDKKEVTSTSTSRSSLPAGPGLTVTYRFVHEGQLRQWSETRDFVCPWCELDCRRARPLVAHLTACHPRFSFRSHHAPSRNHLSLEVTLSKDFDSSNDSLGFRRQVAHRVARPLGGGLASSSCPPSRRLPFTHLVHWKGLTQTNATPTSASGRPLRVGHYRQYYHTWSSLPIHPNEFDIDSEEEDSTSWLYQYYERNIAEFTDVNAGEKRLMTLWNAHLIRHQFLGDGQVGLAAESFVREQGGLIQREGLRGNLLLHLANLADYGVLRPEMIERCMAVFDQLGAPQDGAAAGTSSMPA